MVTIKRWFIHALTPPWRWRLKFPDTLLRDIEHAIEESESTHRGELRFAVENTLTPGRVWRGLTARQRALEIFSRLGVWDTEENSGVLIYVMLADHEVHIVADRGINHCVNSRQWQAIANHMQSAFSRNEFKTGCLTGIREITELLNQHFPATGKKRNELPDHPVIIGRTLL